MYIRKIIRKPKEAWPNRFCDECDRKNRPHEMEHISKIINRILPKIERKYHETREEDFETSYSNDKRQI